jgi:hypothetical protein
MPSPSPDADEVCTRLARMKELCDQLDAAQTDRRRYNELIERIRREADAFRKTLGTHDQ